MKQLPLKLDAIKAKHLVICEGKYTVLPENKKENFPSKVYKAEDFYHVMFPISKEELDAIEEAAKAKQYVNDPRSPFGEFLIYGDTDKAGYFSLSTVILPTIVSRADKAVSVFPEFITKDRSDFNKALTIMNEDSLSSFRDAVNFLGKPQFVVVVKILNRTTYEKYKDSTPFLSI
jgi:hypothetical protein